MAASKPEILLPYEIETKFDFDDLTYIFEVRHLNGTSSNTVRPNRKWNIQNGGLQIKNTCILEHENLRLAAEISCLAIAHKQKYTGLFYKIL